MMDGRPTAVDLLAAATAFLLPVAFLPFVDAPFWSPKVAVLLPAAAVGLTRLPGLLRDDRLRRPAVAGLAFLAVAALSALASDDVSQAVFGLYNWGTGAIFAWSLAGMWALGASVTQRGRHLVSVGLVAGVGASSAVGVLQVLVDLPIPFLGSVAGRASGLAGNPVHLAALALGVVALATVRVAERWSWLIPVTVGAAVVEVTGSRFALLALPVLVGLVALIGRVRQALAVLACLVLGLAIGNAMSVIGGQETSSTQRTAALSISGGGVAARSETWLSARHAVADRPLLGVGPGRFRAATSPHRTLALARAEGPDRLFDDAHNIFVEYAVTTGLVGLAAFALWLGSAAHRARPGGLLAFALAVAALHLVQPQSVGSTPLLFLAVGASAERTAAATRHASHRSAAPLAVGGVAVAAATILLVGDARLQQARLDFDDTASRDSLRLLAPWPPPASVRARMFLFQALGEPDGAGQEHALHWRQEALARAPDSPALWNDLATDELAAGRPEAARASYGEALRRDPWSARALAGLAAVGSPGQRRLASERLEALTAE